LSRKGFTLIEILIAVLILGIVLSTVYVSYTGTFRIIHDTRYDAEVYSLARAALDRMARDLQSAAPWRGGFTFTTKTQTLGNREFLHLSFRSAAHIAFSDKEAREGIALIGYGVEEGAEKAGYILTRSDSLYQEPGKDPSTGKGWLLCDGIDSVSYLFFDEAGKEYMSWNSEGDVPAQKKRMPAAILIRLSFVNDTDRERPLVFTTRIRLPLNRMEAS
jgi:prepilin-type N-terminal cleavage/methylation domain-containing protein